MKKIILLQLHDKLRVIDLSYSVHLIRIPDFSSVPNLEILTLEGCTMHLKDWCSSIIITKTNLFFFLFFSFSLESCRMRKPGASSKRHVQVETPSNFVLQWLFKAREISRNQRRYERAKGAWFEWNSYNGLTIINYTSKWSSNSPTWRVFKAPQNPYSYLPFIIIGSIGPRSLQHNGRRNS